jgi:hypothetical protein
VTTFFGLIYFDLVNIDKNMRGGYTKVYYRLANNATSEYMPSADFGKDRFGLVSLKMDALETMNTVGTVYGV